MALAALGVLDLSVVTDTLVDMLRQCIKDSPLNIPPTRFTVSGAQPETVRNGNQSGDCRISLYLFHVAQDKFQRNAPVMGPRSSLIPQQPLSLDLYYLLTAYAKDNYAFEQQGMSVALRCFYTMPIVKTFSFGDPHQEFTLSMEVESADELSRLWQAITTPYRLSVIYKVSVIFITPDAPTTAPAPHPKKPHISVNPTTLPFISEGQVFGTFRTVNYPLPNNSAADPHIGSFDLSPAAVAADETFLLQGAGLNKATSKRVYLVKRDGTEQEVTSWIAPLAPGQAPSDTHYTLKVPLPPNTPDPDIYQLRVGSDTAQGDSQTYRSNTTPFSIAAQVKGPANTAPAILLAVGGVFTLNGIGFTAGKTEVLLDTLPLPETGGTPQTGTFTINGTGTVITFERPNTLPTGRYTVRVRVNEVESNPAWWINVP